MTTTTGAGERERAVLQRMTEWKEAFEAKDVDGIMTFYADGDGFSAFDLMPPIQFRGGDMWRQNWIGFFAAWAGAPSLEFADMEVLVSDRIAVVRLLTRLTGEMGGQHLDMWVRQTNCFRLADEQWLMFHDHVSFPTDFTNGQSLMALSPDKPFG